MIHVKNLVKIYKSPKKTGNPAADFFSRKYKEEKALKSITFDISGKEIVGFIGPNGAGKTTTMKILAGILYPTDGEVSVLGYTPFDKQKEFLKQISFVMGQKNQLLWELPATDSWKLQKEIYEVPDNEYKSTVSNLVELMEVQSFLDRPIKTLSLGQRMRVELITSLLYKPNVLFLDEPTIGLDIFAQSTIINFIREYHRLYGSTIILTSHYMQDVQRLAKRIILINEGEIMYDGGLESMQSEFSGEKIIQLTVNRSIEKEEIEKLPSVRSEYKHPVVKLWVKKENIETTLTKILQTLPYSDVTIENESLEEIIKKMFK